MRVLVMGGTRFNGLALVNELVKHGHEVTIFNRGVSEAAIPRGVRRLYGDRTNHEQLREVLGKEEFDVVQDISAYTVDDVKPMIEIFRGRIAHYIFASSTVIYGPTDILPIRETHAYDLGPDQSEYGRNKILCEQLLWREFHENHFPVTIIAFSMVFGPNNIIPEREQRMFSRLLRGRPVLIPGDGKMLGQVGHVDDEAKALRMVMRNPKTLGKRYNCTGKDYFSVDGYVDTFAEVVGVQPEKLYIPAELMEDIYADRVILEGSVVRNNIETRTGAQPGQNRQFLNSLMQRLAPNEHAWNRSVMFSIDALREDTGWEPDYTFPAMVEQTFEWYRASGLDKSRQFDFGWEDFLIDLVRQRAAEAGK
jgi:nucleoside-diphosphate-sugar epimerase